MKKIQKKKKKDRAEKEEMLKEAGIIPEQAANILVQDDDVPVLFS